MVDVVLKLLCSKGNYLYFFFFPRLFFRASNVRNGQQKVALYAMKEEDRPCIARSLRTVGLPTFSSSVTIVPLFSSTNDV